MPSARRRLPSRPPIRIVWKPRFEARCLVLRSSNSSIMRYVAPFPIVITFRIGCARGPGCGQRVLERELSSSGRHRVMQDLRPQEDIQRNRLLTDPPFDGADDRLTTVVYVHMPDADKFLPPLRKRRLTAQHSLKTAVSGLLIGEVQSFVGAPMHTPGLFRKWIEKVYTSVQTHSNFLCFCEPTPTS